ncbi:uncharacterized protein N7511_003613 [Penicillium nucicola]|uniref:uncharacterized protein n=1 Tax=Penicillium nucicola TaxID=1850975 RepID=UPI002544EE08|nr:uncharacterized protein N7511_003613 [Penicillium nucicola]KAJ5765997.1 hypothetical protein N7511_003613 [Penicillium nucicola]
MCSKSYWKPQHEAATAKDLPQTPSSQSAPQTPTSSVAQCEFAQATEEPVSPSLPSETPLVTGAISSNGHMTHVLRTRDGSSPEGATSREVTSNDVPRRGRVVRACATCRQRKARCSGEMPVCLQCRRLKVICRYPLGWKLEIEREIDSLSTKINEYRTCVQDLLDTGDPPTGYWVRSLLRKHLLMEDTHPKAEVPDQKEISRATRQGGKRRLSKGGRIRMEKGAQGVKIGQKHGDLLAEKDLPWGVVSGLNDLSINVPTAVDRYWLPPRHIADQLIEDYFTTVHPGFPILSRPEFRAQYLSAWNNPRPLGDKWLAILNIIFAISAKHAYLTDASWRGLDNDHLVYLTRARLLSMTEVELFGRPDPQQVQIEGLIAFYLLASDQIDRAWRISAIAVRSAVTLGFSEVVSDTSTNEVRNRLWRCLYNLEQILGHITDRTISISERLCSTPLPLPFEEEEFEQNSAALTLLRSPMIRHERIDQIMSSSRTLPNADNNGHWRLRPPDDAWLKRIPANSGLYYLFYSDLTILLQAIIDNRHSTATCAKKDSQIDDLQSQLQYWRRSLPPSLDFNQVEISSGVSHVRYKLSLAFQYHSTLITLGQSWLHRRGKDELSSMPLLSHEMAMLTLDAAMRTLDIFPCEPSVARLYQMCPWWCVLHYLTQAANVVLRELSLSSVHMPDEELHLVWQAKKSIRWFHAMSVYSPGARRLWQICDSAFRKLASRKLYNTEDIPSTPIEPTFSTHISSRQPIDNFVLSDEADVGYFGLMMKDINLSNWDEL